MAFEKCEENAFRLLSEGDTIYSKYSFVYVMLYDMLKALEFLHSRNIVHRDIKLENILLKEGIFKLCDFGLSRVLNQEKRFTIEVGNIMAKAPEVYKGHYDSKVDIWSIGITVYIIAFG